MFAVKKQFIIHTGFDIGFITYKKCAVIINYLPDKYSIIIKCLHLSKWCEHKKNLNSILNICTLQLHPFTYALIKYNLLRNKRIVL